MVPAKFKNEGLTRDEGVGVRENFGEDQRKTKFRTWGNWSVRESERMRDRSRKEETDWQTDK